MRNFSAFSWREKVIDNAVVAPGVKDAIPGSLDGYA
jgi:hypothetical protein